MPSTGTYFSNLSPDKRPIVVSAIWAFGGKVITAATTLSINALLARLFSAHGFGTYLLVLSTVTLGSMVGALGLHQALVRFIAENMEHLPGRSKHAASRILFLGIIAAFIIGTSYFLVGGRIADFLHSPEIKSITGLISGWIVALTVQALLAEAFRGFHDIRSATLFGGLLTGILFLVFLTGIYVMELHINIFIIAIASIGFTIVNVLSSFYFLRPKIRSLAASKQTERIKLKEIWSTSWPLLITNLSIYALTQADIWILGTMSSQDQVAIYGAASRLAVLIMFANAILFAVLPPVIAEKHAKKERVDLERILRAGASISMLIAFPFFLFYVLVGDKILSSVYGNDYKEGWYILIILSTGLLVNVFTGVRGFVLMFTGNERLQLIISVIGGGMNILLCLLLGKRWGALGVAYGAMSAMIIQCVLEMIAVRVCLGIQTHCSIQSTVRVMKQLVNLKLLKSQQ